MEVIWCILGGVAWIIGAVMTAYDIYTDDDIRKNMASFADDVAEDGRMFPFFLSVLLCLIIVLICAFWPAFTIAAIGRRILRKAVRK